jgi:hypothetical protein
MKLRLAVPLFALCSLAAASDAIQYSADGKLMLPPDYREWVFLNSGAGMTYGPAGAMMSRKNPFFDNVFVNREAYRAFVNTGRWPDKTIFVLEIRRSASHAAPNNGGHFQTDLTAIEVAVKDESKPDKWVYYDFKTTLGKPVTSAEPLPKNAGCFACHTSMGAVENTFVQFYPTLYEVAEAKGTLNARFKRPLPTPDRFYKIVVNEGWDTARKTLDEIIAKDPDSATLEEQTLNTLGYQLLGDQKQTEAIQLLEFVTARYPQSANAQDSLAEVYEKTGQKDKARQASEKALALLPGDPSPEQRKKRLETAIRQRLEKLK